MSAKSVTQAPPFHFLPLWARVAYERLAQDERLRNAATLNNLLTSYAGSYGEEVDLDGPIAAAVHQRASAMFFDFVA